MKKDYGVPGLLIRLGLEFESPLSIPYAVASMDEVNEGEMM